MAYNIDQKIQAAKEAGYSEDEIYSFLRGKGFKPDDIITLSSKQQPQQPQGNTGLKGFSTGLAKSAILQPLRGAGRLGQEVLQQTVGRGLEAVTGKNRESFGTPMFEGDMPESLKTKGAAEDLGGLVGSVALFLAPSGKLGALEKGQSLLTRSAIEGGFSGGLTALQQGKFDEKAKTSAIVGALFPIAGAALKEGKQLVGKGLTRMGEKIEQVAIKPSKADFSDGFKLENLQKYKIQGNLAQMAESTQGRLNDLSKQLNQTLKSQNTAVNLNNVLKKTTDRLVGQNKLSNFGSNQQIKNVIDSLGNEVKEVAGPNGLVDLYEATLVKRGAGTKGAWTFGSSDPNSTAIEKVYTTFYQEMRKAIEEVSPSTIKEVNKQISELIPISNALIRRIPVESRNGVLSLGDNLSLFGSLFDPRSLAVFGANRLARNPRFGSFLARLGEGIAKEPATRTAIGERAFGGSLSSLKKQPIGLSTKAVDPKSIASKLDDVDKNVMTKFIDYVRLRGKQNPEIEIAARRVFETMGLNPNVNNSQIANQFDNILSYARGGVKSIPALREALEGNTPNTLKMYDKYIMSGDLKAADIYKDTARKIFTSQTAARVIQDTTNLFKMQGFPELAEKFLKLIDPNKLTPDIVLKTARSLIR